MGFKIRGTMKVLEVASTQRSLEGFKVQASKSNQNLDEIVSKFGLKFEATDKTLYFRCKMLGYDLPNGNGDAVPRIYANDFGPSFIGKILDVNHQTDPEHIIGKILTTFHVEQPIILSEADERIIGRNVLEGLEDVEARELQLEGICMIDRTTVLGNDIAKKLISGVLTMVSQEASTEYAECSVCGHRIDSPYSGICGHLDHGSLMVKAYAVEGKKHKVLAFKKHANPVGTGLGVVTVGAYSKADVMDLVANLKGGKIKAEEAVAQLAIQERVFGRSPLLIEASAQVETVAASLGLSETVLKALKKIDGVETLALMKEFGQIKADYTDTPVANPLQAVSCPECNIALRYAGIAGSNHNYTCARCNKSFFRPAGKMAPLKAEEGLQVTELKTEVSSTSPKVELDEKAVPTREDAESSMSVTEVGNALGVKEEGEPKDVEKETEEAKKAAEAYAKGSDKEGPKESAEAPKIEGAATKFPIRLTNGKWKDQNGNSHENFEDALRSQAGLDGTDDETALENAMVSLGQKWKGPHGGHPQYLPMSHRWKDSNGNSYDTYEEAEEASVGVQASKNDIHEVIATFFRKPELAASYWVVADKDEKVLGRFTLGAIAHGNLNRTVKFEGKDVDLSKHLQSPEYGKDLVAHVLAFGAKKVLGTLQAAEDMPKAIDYSDHENLSSMVQNPQAFGEGAAEAHALKLKKKYPAHLHNQIDESLASAKAAASGKVKADLPKHDEEHVEVVKTLEDVEKDVVEHALEDTKNPKAVAEAITAEAASYVPALESMLATDESSTDEELGAKLMNSFGIDQEEAEAWVARRGEYLTGHEALDAPRDMTPPTYAVPVTDSPGLNAGNVEILKDPETVEGPLGKTTRRWRGKGEPIAEMPTAEALKDRTENAAKLKASIDDSMLQQYLATALWSSHGDRNPETGEDPLDARHGNEDFSPEALAVAERDITSFVTLAAPLLEGCTADASQMGHDFWLTRNGHGAGFWDRPEMYKDQANADALSDIARQFGEQLAVEGDDGKLYLEGGKEPKALQEEHVEAALVAAPSKEAQAWISNKIAKLVKEGKEQKQAEAIAYSMAKKKGFDALAKDEPDYTETKLETAGTNSELVAGLKPSDFKVGDRVHSKKMDDDGTVTYVSNDQITVDWDFPGQSLLGPMPIPAKKLGDITKIAVSAPEEEVEEVEEESSEEREPDPEMDIIIIGEDDLSAYYAGKEIASVTREEADEDGDALEKAVAAWMKQHQYFPDVWWISDHGNSNVVTERFHKYLDAAQEKFMVKTILGSYGVNTFVVTRGKKTVAGPFDSEREAQIMFMNMQAAATPIKAIQPGYYEEADLGYPEPDVEVKRQFIIDNLGLTEEEVMDPNVRKPEDVAAATPEEVEELFTMWRSDYEEANGYKPKEEALLTAKPVRKKLLTTFEALSRTLVAATRLSQALHGSNPEVTSKGAEFSTMSAAGLDNYVVLVDRRGKGLVSVNGKPGVDITGYPHNPVPEV